jgi:hypothetical protein
MEALDQAVLGSIEFDHLSVPNSAPGSSWYFSGRGEVDGNFFFDPPDTLDTEMYTYDSSGGWTQHVTNTVTATVTGNQIQLIVPAENASYLEAPTFDDLRVWVGVTTPEYAICDAALWDENDMANGQIPPRP